MDLARLAYYPFLDEARQAVRELGPELPDLLTGNLYVGVRERAAARVRGALTDRTIPAAEVRTDRGALAEVMSVPVARMLVVLLGDRTLVARYAAAEGARLADVLRQDAPSLEAIADALAVPVERDGTWRIHFADYLRVAPVWEDDWKLIQRPMARGWLPLTDKDLAALCGRALEARIQAELDEELKRPVHADVQTALASIVEALAEELAEAKQDWNTGDFGPVQDRLFPPCIHQIFDQMKDGAMVTHHARFAMASFLATVGMTAQDIMDYFRTIPNFDPDKSRYQITHIAGEQGVDKYTPPGCATMQTNGICPLEKRDNLCFKIKHPLSYYRARLKFQKQDEQKAEAMLEAEKTKQHAMKAMERRDG